MHPLSFAFFPALAAMLAPPVLAQEDALRAKLGVVWEELAEESFQRQIGKLLSTKPGFAELYSALRAGPCYSKDVPRGWVEGVMRCEDGKERPYLVYVPKDYNPAQSYLLLMHLHGGVSRPQALTHEQLRQTRFYWGKQAEQHGFFHLIPSGQGGAEWWSRVGSHNVLAQIDRLRCSYKIDPNRVFSTGFSDGASGSFYLALTHPTRFAGFVPLNGHVAVARAGGLQVHLQGLVNKPLYVINTDKDSLYPAKSVSPFIAAMKGLGVDIDYTMVEGFGHEPSYLPKERPLIWSWIRKQKRQPHPERILWQGSGDAPARVHWLEVLGVDAGLKGAKFADPNPMMKPSRVRLGVQLDRAFAGPGCRLSLVTDASPAKAAGLKKGDVLLAMNGVEIKSMQTLRALLGRVNFGSTFTLRVARGEKILALKGEFPAVAAKPAFPRNKPFGSIEAKRQGNRVALRSSGISRVALLLSPEVFDFEKPLKLTVNGRDLREVKLQRDPRFLLEQAHRDQDPSMLYAARLELDLRGDK